MTHASRFAVVLLAVLLISGCGAGTATTNSASPASSQPTTTVTPSAPAATRIEKEAEHEPAAEKARRQKMLKEVIAGCAACRDHPSGPPPMSPAKEREAAEKANEKRQAEATKQVEAIKEYKRLKAEGK